ncbi:hypothetical protein [Methylobacterium sp. J-067]|uniref:hypothetical protein n=1 Tax=Methylobacterium sp. J-067 TaxID=2836648 RepID=UPI001FBB811B|nr:hypothetical protein [Methylobacterium sp. J-067]MCJ2023904.1 hypothetical protein [Methylobacterium sp. J-067]
MRKQLNSFTVEQAKSYRERKRTIREWGRWIDRKLDEGWEGYLVTLMYKQIRGSEATKIEVMGKEVVRVYATFLTHLFRRPNAPSSRGKLPILIAAPDYPVAKHQKVILEEVKINDGLHFHGVLLVHPDRRLKGRVEDYFDNNMHVYVNNKHELLRLHLRPIEEHASYVTGYGYKTIRKRASIGLDGFVVLPRIESEMPS